MEKKKILVVEPNKDVCTEVVKELIKQGHTVVTANMPVSALSLVKSGIGLVITDGVIGKSHRTVEASEWARRICANVPVILFTTSLHHFDMPNVVYVQKSLGISSLVDLVSKV